MSETRAPEAEVEYSWRGSFDNHELNALHAEAFEHAITVDDWHGQVERHSLGWVSARRDGHLVAWVNVAWDGSVHAFILDTIVTAALRRCGGAASVRSSFASRSSRRGSPAASGSMSTSTMSWPRSTSRRAAFDQRQPA